MHRIAIILLSLLLVVAPVAAQEPTPIPPSASSVVRDVVEATQALGTVTIVILAALAVLVLIVVFFVVAVWRLGSPLVNTVQRLMETVRSLMEARDRRDLEDDTRKQAQIAVLERYKALLEDIETKEDAVKSRESAVTQINAHTDAAVEPTIENSKEAVDDLKKLSEQMKKLVTQEHFDGTMTDMQKQLDAIIEKMEHKVDAPPAPAPETPLAEDAKMSSDGNATKE